MSGELPPRPIRVLCDTVGADLVFNLTHKEHVYNLVMRYTVIIQAKKHYSWQRYAGSTLNQLTSNYPQKTLTYPVGSKLCQAVLFVFRMIRIHQLTKKSGTNLWSDFSCAKDNSPKGHKLPLQVHDPTITKQYIMVMCRTKNNIWEKKIRGLS